ncbi:MAG: hypothetical protein AAGC55_22135, partial [Myxococcota bacterium]
GPVVRVDRRGGDAGRAVGVTGRKDLVTVRQTESEHIAATLALLARARVPLFHADYGDGSAPVLTAWLALADVPDWPAVRAEIAAIPGAQIIEERGAVSAVGHDVGGDAAALSTLAQVAGAPSAAIDRLVCGPLRVTALCAADRVDDLVRAAHRALCESAQ